MRQKIASYALALPLLLAAMQAAAVTTPELSLSNVAYTSSNLGTVSPSTGAVTAQSGGQSWTTSTTTSHSTLSVVQTAPTATTSGLAYDYDVITSSYYSHVETWNYDTASLSLSASGTEFGANKTATIAGTLASSADTAVTLYVYANGAYQTNNTFFGPSTPALPTLYIGGSLATIAPVAHQYTTTDSANQTYTVQNNYYYTYDLTLTAGQSVDFIAGIYAPSQTSLSDFSVSVTGAIYNDKDVATLHTSSYQVLTGAHILAVPEPEPAMMMLAGLGLILLRRSRRATNQKLG